ncbi:16S rRNA methyltransferase [Oceanicola sp. 22II-s10i]|uniref:16S rRNA (cytidine(1402)-2'-O)-methyltransferase n=1 Tax=Oceanicola sp. 22II-s10i TaxID=1317116 RepID=UPI000B5265B2|nr:16S rRNA (cytidine(1402)-2'-O)-methyltransferase [Oceanicola sp. 22II-s10i]OWU83286.1 16S rRNA methyltransferase [Oceanicola sp. 22II-s10i]
MSKGELAPGLYLVSVPIGTARDITLRALDTLASAEVLAAEDTRSLRRLMDIHGIALNGRPLVAYHDHNGAKMRPRLLADLAAGRSVAYASEAGTPLVADPGFDLARAAREAGHVVTAAPGVTAAITALTLSGLPSDRFLFAGFLPNSSAKRRSALEELAGLPATLILYESPKRTAALLADAAAVLGPDRPAALCRELTKRFEEVRRGGLADLAAGCEDAPPKGEVVVLIGQGASEKISESDLDTLLMAALSDGTVRDAADKVAGATGLPRREVYQRALALGRRDADG